MQKSCKKYRKLGKTNLTFRIYAVNYQDKWGIPVSKRGCVLCYKKNHKV